MCKAEINLVKYANSITKAMDIMEIAPDLLVPLSGMVISKLSVSEHVRKRNMHAMRNTNYSTSKWTCSKLILHMNSKVLVCNGKISLCIRVE